MFHSIFYSIPTIFILFILPVNSYGELYRCLNDKGQTEFSGTPCDENTQPYKIKNNPTLKFEDIKPLRYSKPKASKNNKQASKKSKLCRFFTSTELRNLRVKDQFKKGMPAPSIAKRFGVPEEVDTKSGNKEIWKYKSDRLKRTFKFKDDCLVSWKIKWHGQKSQISKYQQ